VGKKDRMIRGSPHDWSHAPVNPPIQMKRNPKFTTASLGLRLAHDTAKAPVAVYRGGSWYDEDGLAQDAHANECRLNFCDFSLGIRLVHNIND
jgi:hypothetical protein